MRGKAVSHRKANSRLACKSTHQNCWVLRCENGSTSQHHAYSSKPKRHIIIISQLCSCTSSINHARYTCYWKEKNYIAPMRTTDSNLLQKCINEFSQILGIDSGTKGLLEAFSDWLQFLFIIPLWELLTLQCENKRMLTALFTEYGTPSDYWTWSINFEQKTWKHGYDFISFAKRIYQLTS